MPFEDFRCGGHALFLKPFGIQRGNRFVFADLAIQNRLRVTGIVALVVAVFAVTDHIEHDVLVKPLPVLIRELRRADARFGIVAIHMEHRRLHHQCDIGAILRRPAGFGIGGEADLVVDHQVDRAAGVVTGNTREIDGLRDHSLADHGRIAVNHDGDHAFAFFIAQAILFRPYQPFDDGIHGLEMAGIERDRDGNLLAA